MLELNKFQHELLMVAANSGNMVFVTVHPNEHDTAEKYKALAEDVASVKQLVEQGFAIDISNRFAEQIEMSKVNNNRAISVYSLTKMGFQMFNNCESREIN